MSAMLPPGPDWNDQMRKLWILTGFLFQGILPFAVLATTPSEIAITAFNETAQNLAQIEVVGTWEKTGPDDFRLSGYFRLLNHPEKFYLKTICTEKHVADDARASLASVPDMVIMVDDGSTLAVNVFGARTGPRPCLIRLHQPTRTTRRSHNYHLGRDVSILAAILNPPAAREDAGQSKKEGDSLVSKTSPYENYWRTMRLSPESGFNVTRWQMIDKVTGEPVGAGETAWKHDASVWVPTRYHAWSVADQKGGISSVTLSFKTIDRDHTEQKADYSVSALEPCEDAMIFDHRPAGRPVLYRLDPLREDTTVTDGVKKLGELPGTGY